MSKITEFYEAKGVDCDGRKIADIWGTSDEYLEYCHNWVQWLFPLIEASSFNPDAPLLTEDDINVFKTNSIIQSNLHRSFIRYINFFGLAYTEGEIISTSLFEPILFKMANHNWFRITRVLKSCKLLGLEKEALAFYRFLKKIHEENGWVSENSFSYWQQAIT